MKNSSICFFMLIGILALAISPSAFAIQFEPNVTVQILRYEPYPAEPGQYFDLWLNVQNYAITPANQVTAEILPSYPFSIDASENATRYFGTLGSLGNAIVDYKVRVASDAVEGWNQIKIRTETSSGVWTTTNMSIYVRSPQTVISISSASTTPSQIAPGATGTLNIVLSNMGNSVLNDVTAKLDLSAINVYPIGTATEEKTYILQPGENVTMPFSIMAGNGLDAGAYKIPVTITYKDATGTSFTKSDYVTLVVGDSPDILTGIEKTAILKSGSSGIVTLKVINRGLTGVKLLYVTLKSSGDYEILSPSPTLYVGKLDSDGYETVEYNIYVKPGVNNTLQIPIQLDFRDDNNAPFSESRVIDMRLFTQAEAEQYGLVLPAGISLWIIILVLIVIGYIAYRRFFRKSKR